jgi:hypothetical protein
MGRAMRAALVLAAAAECLTASFAPDDPDSCSQDVALCVALMDDAGEWIDHWDSSQFIEPVSFRRCRDRGGALPLRIRGRSYSTTRRLRTNAYCATSASPACADMKALLTRPASPAQATGRRDQECELGGRMHRLTKAGARLRCPSSGSAGQSAPPADPYRALYGGATPCGTSADERTARARSRAGSWVFALLLPARRHLPAPRHHRRPVAKNREATAQAEALARGVSRHAALLRTSCAAQEGDCGGGVGDLCTRSGCVV